MTARLRAAYDWLMAKDWITWLGHGLLGALMYLLFRSFAVVFVAFLYLEMSDLLAWYLDPNPVWDGPSPVRRGHKPGLGAKLRDGFLDLWAPLVGAALVGLLLGP